MRTNNSLAMQITVSIFALCCAVSNIHARKFRRSSEEPEEKIEARGLHRKPVEFKKKTKSPSRFQAIKHLAKTQTPPKAATVEVQNHTAEQNLIPIDQKISMTRKFRTNIDFISKTIMDGETDESERHDFQTRFENQKTWFTSTVERARTTSDPAFIEVTQKLAQIEEISNALHDADTILTRLANKKPRHEREMRQLKTQTLYEINAQLNQNKGATRILSDSELTHLVSKTVKKFDATKEMPSLITSAEYTSSQPCPKLVDRLKEQNMFMATELERITQEKDRINQSLQQAKATGKNEELLREIDNLKKTRDDLRSIAARETEARLNLEIQLSRTTHGTKTSNKKPSPLARNRSQFKTSMNFGQPNKKTRSSINVSGNKMNYGILEDPYAAFDEISDLFDTSSPS